MSEVASAFISLLPSLKGFESKLDGQISSPLAAVGRRGGFLLGRKMLEGFAAVGVVAAVGKVLHDISSEAELPAYFTEAGA